MKVNEEMILNSLSSLSEDVSRLQELYLALFEQVKRTNLALNVISRNIEILPQQFPEMDVAKLSDELIARSVASTKVADVVYRMSYKAVAQNRIDEIQQIEKLNKDKGLDAISIRKRLPEISKETLSILWVLCQSTPLYRLNVESSHSTLDTLGALLDSQIRKSRFTVWGRLTFFMKSLITKK